MKEENKSQGKEPIELLSQTLIEAGFEDVKGICGTYVSFKWRDHLFCATLEEDYVKISEPYFLLMNTGCKEEEYLNIVLEKYFETYSGEFVLKRWDREDDKTLFGIYCYKTNTYPDFAPKKMKSIVLSIAVAGEWIKSHVLVCMKHGGWPYD